MGKFVVIIFFMVGFVIFTLIKLAAKGVKEAYIAVNEPEIYRQPVTINPPSSATKTATKSITIDGSNDADEENRERAHKATQLATEWLSTHLAIIKAGGNDIPPSAKDDFSIGYVGGFTDATQQQFGVSQDMSAYAGMTMVFMNIYGMDDGASYFRKFMDMQQSQNSEFMEGLIRGGNDVMAMGKDDEEDAPMTWLKHHVDKTSA